MQLNCIKIYPFPLITKTTYMQNNMQFQQTKKISLDLDHKHEQDAQVILTDEKLLFDLDRVDELDEKAISTNINRYISLDLDCAQVRNEIWKKIMYENSIKISGQENKKKWKAKRLLIKSHTFWDTEASSSWKVWGQSNLAFYVTACF